MVDKKADKKDLLKHVLIPEHTKLSDKDKKALLAKYNISMRELPKIFLKDAGITHLDVKEGDVIKITRNSPTAGTTVFYRGIINE